MKPILDYLKDNNFPNKLTRDQAVLLSYAHIDKTGLRRTFIAPKRQVVIKNWFKKTYNVELDHSGFSAKTNSSAFVLLTPIPYVEDFKVLIAFRREEIVKGIAKSISIRYEWFQYGLELKNIKIYFVLNFDNLQRERMYTIDKDWNIILAEE